MSEVLHLDGVSKGFTASGATITAVREVSLHVRGGEAVLITGPSGAGKTTLLALAAGLLEPDAGRVWWSGEEIGHLPRSALQRRRLSSIGFVFQRGLLLRHLTVLRNVALVAEASGQSRREAGIAAATLLERLGLSARAHLLPEALSAGECQRAALARALILSPALVLADEPTAHLDSRNGAVVAATLRGLAAENGAGLLIVTHDARLAEIADRVLTIEDGHLGGGR